MELVGYCVQHDDEAKSLLATVKSTRYDHKSKEVLDAAAKLEAKAMKQMLVFEGKKKRERKVGAKYRGVSRRVAAYKHMLITHLPEHYQGRKPGMQPLCTLEDLGYLDGKPTAPGTQNISTFARVVQAFTGSPSKEPSGNPKDASK